MTWYGQEKHHPILSWPIQAPDHADPLPWPLPRQGKELEGFPVGDPLTWRVAFYCFVLLALECSWSSEFILYIYSILGVQIPFDIRSCDIVCQAGELGRFHIRHTSPILETILHLGPISHVLMSSMCFCTPRGTLAAEVP